MYNGRQNTYTIEKDGRTFVLTPLNEETKEKGEIIMIGRKEYVSVEEGKSMILAANARHDIVGTVDRNSEDDLQSVVKKADGMVTQVSTIKIESEKIVERQEMGEGIFIGTVMCPVAEKQVKR